MFRGRFWVYDPLGSKSKRHEPLMLSLRKPAEELSLIWARISEGDIIKLGRNKYLVKELVRKSEPPEIDNSHKIAVEIVDTLEYNTPIKFNTKIEKKEGRSDVKCRICLCEDNEKSNPIITSPCECLGSVRYIHWDCLQQWLKSKVMECRNRFSTSYYWKDFECDVCKSMYPSNYKHNNREHSEAGRNYDGGIQNREAQLAVPGFGKVQGH
eukprot:TRINITY_DN14754_c0_g1_i3.p1 TRINITY_DN14754_c0_g1~~TRINITY_DN14754_c0_g1_i3.p1  ORF type:complete len:211 (+),score=20.97 TRINITY_DN14754_c0_g1_i3:426-1058(+)